MHVWDDYLYFEIIDPKTGQIQPEGESGELVITTLRKEGAPLIRYRTHDLTRFIPGKCACGMEYPRIDTLIGRSDDMVKVNGVVIYPNSVNELLSKIDGISSEFQIMIDHLNGKDALTLFFESEIKDGGTQRILERTIEREFKEKIGIKASAKAVAIGDFPRSEKNQPVCLTTGIDILLLSDVIHNIIS